jgi:carbon-monoxide dehydrogenase large subunit
VLAIDRVRYAGEPVAFVVAESRAQARDAAEAIEVEYQAEAATIGTAEAPTASSRVHADRPDNVAFRWHKGDAEGTEAAFARAAHVTRLSIINNRIVVNPIETRSANAAWDSSTGRLTLYTSTQGGWGIKQAIAGTYLKVEPEKVRVVTPDVGGGFGMKIFLYPEHILVSLAARKLGRPVKWTGDRSESFLSDSGGRDHATEAELALDADDRMIALRVRVTANMGAYFSPFGPFIPTMAGVRVAPGVYAIPVMSYTATGVFTNTTPVDAYRGAGRPESNYVTERLVDRAARERGYDPAEFRRRNLIPTSAIPWDSAVFERYESGNFPAILDAAIDKADTAGFARRKEESQRQGKLRGMGVACYVEAMGGGPEEWADIRFQADGRVSVAVGTQSNGQGHETAFTQVVADKLGVPFEAIDIIQGDTDLIPTGGGTGGSHSLAAESEAIEVAGNEVIEKAKALAAEDFEASLGDVEFRVGSLGVAGTDISASLLDLAVKHPGALDTRAKCHMPNYGFPNGCHIAEVEIERQTGVTRLVRYTVVDDFGRVVNPMIVAGQVYGGIAQGVGQALLEHTVYDPSGQLLSGSYMDYCLPKAHDLPDMSFNYIEVPTPNNTLGAKGCGEAGAIAAPPAVVNAVVDALWKGAGSPVPVIDMPVTSEKVWKALASA